MKIFGGFGGKHLHGREAVTDVPEQETLSPEVEAAAGSGSQTSLRNAAYEPESDSGETVIAEPDSGETVIAEPDSGETVRTPEEQAEIDEMIRRYQRKKRIRRGIILGVIAQKEGITMTDEELEERLQGYADQYGIDVEELVEGQDMGYIRKNELDQRVLTWLRENVAVEEIAETEAMTAEQTEAETDAAQTEAQIAETETEA